MDNFSKCTRFETCSIPKCPLDEDMDLRVETPEDEICPLRRITEGHRRTSRIKVKLSSKMKQSVNFVPTKNLKMAHRAK